jgi:predicted transcriptional regulator
MQITLHHEIARRLKAIANAQRCTVSALVQRVVAQAIGMEGMPLEDEAVYGKEKQNDKT